MDRSYRIYLSPANHYKRYIIEGRTEKEEMDRLAPLLVAELEKYRGVEVILTDVYNPDRSYTGRPEDARDLDCDIYIALHTNAGGGKGACLFYHPDYPLSKLLALAMVKELNRICPIKSNRAVQPAIYPWSRKEWNFGELRLPASYGMAPVLVEHEFHDTPEGAAWIISSLDEIAAADAKAIAEVLGLEKKLTVGDANGDGEVNSLDATAILKHDAGIATLEGERLSAADINGDGEVNSLDATAVLRKDADIE